MPRLLIITVNFRHADCTLEFLASASRLDGFANCHLTIVDNDSGDDSVSRVGEAVRAFNNVELLASEENRGYFGGARWAQDRYLAHHPSPDWLIVCNNDISFEDLNFLSKLFNKDPDASGLIAPSIISALTGHDANPSIRFRPSRFRMLRYRLWLSNFYAMWFKQLVSPAVRRARFSFYNRTPTEVSVRRPIYAPHGSFLIFSRRFFEAGGLLDDGCFLYGEEFRVAEMCRQLGLPVIHDPELKVWHGEGQTLGRMLTRESYLHQKNGFRYALNRYRNSYPELLRAGSLGNAAVMKQSRIPRPISTAGDRAS